MADAKISELTALAAVDLDIANDLIAVVDTSATQTKKIAVDDILGNLSTLTAIDTSITATAVDVFVYDTSKDSDGGAWRKRCQHTSWYNETLNTATRGSRREFPAVAVIVAEAAKVTIYDGDDPTLPMWMVFNASTVNNSFNATAIFGHSGAPTSSVSALNGEVVVGCSAVTSNLGVRAANFISDSAWYKRQFNDMAWLLALADRNINDGSVKWASVGSQVIVNNSVNDVAMTVLPDAPIDPATGLPVPTIAVATDGGVSVIKDDGTVVDWTPTGDGYVPSIHIDAGGIVTNAGGGIAWKFFFLDEIPASDSSAAPSFTFNQTSTPARMGLDSNTGVTEVVKTNSVFALPSSSGSGQRGLNLLSIDRDMVAYTTSTYNTGWMNGDIKGAFLADTDDTDLVATNTISDRSVNALTLTLADAATVQAVATGAELVSYTFAGAESVTLGSDISTTGALIWWEKVSGIWQLNINDLSGGTDYVNGIVGTVSTGLTISGTTLSFAASKEMALARATATIPTADQISKIYEDEKFLFQDNAKAVLAGTSDAVTALAYDDTTEELLVGTSQYTSVFRGLRRVDEISGSASAISSSNGLRVIED